MSVIKTIVSRITGMMMTKKRNDVIISLVKVFNLYALLLLGDVSRPVKQIAVLQFLSWYSHTNHK